MAKVEIKKPIVDEISELLKDAKSAVLVDYRGLTVEQDTALRKQLREAGVVYKVYKNTMINFAVKGTEFEELSKHLEGPTAIVYGTGDYLEPAKIIYNFSKDNDFYKIKGGIIDGKVMTAEEIIALAKLPSRQELLGMLAGALLGNISKLAVGLNEVCKQKENV